MGLGEAFARIRLLRGGSIGLVRSAAQNGPSPECHNISPVSTEERAPWILSGPSPGAGWCCLLSRVIQVLGGSTNVGSTPWRARRPRTRAPSIRWCLPPTSKPVPSRRRSTSSKVGSAFKRRRTSAVTAGDPVSTGRPHRWLTPQSEFPATLQQPAAGPVVHARPGFLDPG